MFAFLFVQAVGHLLENNLEITVLANGVFLNSNRYMFVTRNYVYETGSIAGFLGQLKWESLKKRRKDNRLVLLYKGLKGNARIPTDDLIPKTRRGKNQHFLAFQIPSASKASSPKLSGTGITPESLISSSERSDDGVSKFTSLVRARD